MNVCTVFVVYFVLWDVDQFDIVGMKLLYGVGVILLVVVGTLVNNVFFF